MKIKKFLKATKELIMKENCNYLSILSTDDVYSINFQQDLDAYFSDNNLKSSVCFNTNEKLILSAEDADEKKRNEIRDSITRITSLYQKKEDIFILFFGYTKELQMIIEELNQTLKNNTKIESKQISILCFETNQYELARLKLNLNSTIRLFSMLHSNWGVNNNIDLKIFYRSVLQKVSDNALRLEIYQNNPWLIECIMQTSHCIFNDSEYNSTYLSKIFNYTNVCNSKILQKDYPLYESRYLNYLIYSLGSFYSLIQTNCRENASNSNCLNEYSLAKVSKIMNNGTFDLSGNILVPHILQKDVQIQNGTYRSDNKTLFDFWDIITGVKVNFEQ